ncbi:uncharacterized protein LOC122312696 [Carya illinoinensis]|uniref:uncharacterized protein LOC122312696 n=1 Tax=Carya illinoinensis TaxID=32201 RepID=UPI001C71888E|nr:uncharacterized protein LOC122312696 [Carya illinoinensis]
MASASSNVPVVTTPPTSSTEQQQLISVHADTQLPLKLTPTSYPSWRAQFVTLLIGYDLMGFIDSTHCCPSRGDPTLPPSAAYLLRHIQCGNDFEAYMPTGLELVLQLKEDLTLIQSGSRSVNDFLQFVKVIADEITVINAPLSADDITLYVLNGFGSDFKDIVSPIRAREKSFQF